MFKNECYLNKYFHYFPAQVELHRTATKLHVKLFLAFINRFRQYKNIYWSEYTNLNLLFLLIPFQKYFRP